MSGACASKLSSPLLIWQQCRPALSTQQPSVGCSGLTIKPFLLLLTCSRSFQPSCHACNGVQLDITVHTPHYASRDCLKDALNGVQLSVAKEIVKQDGFGSLYKGLSAGLLRQATYTTARLGIFQGLSDYLKKANDGKVHYLSLYSPIYHPCLTSSSA